MSGRPSWVTDVDATTLFYCSEIAWELFGKDGDRFDEDSLGARDFAMTAALYFEQQHPGDSEYWSENDCARDYLGTMCIYSNLLMTKFKPLKRIVVYEIEHLTAVLEAETVSEVPS